MALGVVEYLIELFAATRTSRVKVERSVAIFMMGRREMLERTLPVGRDMEVCCIFYIFLSRGLEPASHHEVT
jgi:hypothetical protein